MRATIKLGSVTKKIGSGVTPRGGEKVYRTEGTALIRSQNVYDYRFVEDGLVYIDDTEAKRMKGVEIQKNDVLINITGDSVGRCCIVPEKVLPARVNQHVCILRADPAQLNSRYLMYYINEPGNKQRLLNQVHGGTRKALTKGILEAFEITIPSLRTQEKIAEILGSLDDKIELNRRMNETLEQMAMALYKHWFVDGEVYQDVPNGKVEDFAKIIGGGTPKTSVDEYWGGDIPWVSVKDLSDTFVYNTEKTITEKGLQESSTKLIPKHATIVSARGTVGELSITGRPMAMNQSCYAFYSNELPFFTYLTLKFSIDTLKKNSHGSVFSTITRETINLLDVPYDPDVCSDFEKKVDSLFFQIDSNIRENMILTQTRDYLLPRLLSGEIEVREAEEQVEEVLANA